MSSVARSVRESVDRSPFLTQTTESGWRLLHLGLRPRKIRRYFDSTDRVRVMIGAGPSARKGWLATDILPSRKDVVLLDANDPFPFADSSVDRIHSEHMIEHVDHLIGERMLSECFRVLKPGGRIRLATPDIDRVLALAAPATAELAEMTQAANRRHHIPAPDDAEPIYAINRLFSGYGHRFLYSEALLRLALERAGFVSVTRYGVGESDDPDYVGIEAHGDQIDAAWNEYQTLVLEAEKPS